MRSTSEGTGYDRIMTEPIKAKGCAGTYRYIDQTIAPNERCYYELEAVDQRGRHQVFGPIDFTYLVRFGLAQNVPNPFNPATSIRFSIPRAAVVSLVIYDVSGREVRRLVAGKMPAGYHEVAWNGKNNKGAAVSSGMYFCRLQANKDQATRKLILLR
jgi:hypothetical protein